MSDVKQVLQQFLELQAIETRARMERDAIKTRARMERDAAESAAKLDLQKQTLALEKQKLEEGKNNAIKEEHEREQQRALQQQMVTLQQQVVTLQQQMVALPQQMQAWHQQMVALQQEMQACQQKQNDAIMGVATQCKQFQRFLTDSASAPAAVSDGSGANSHHQLVYGPLRSSRSGTGPRQLADGAPRNDSRRNQGMQRDSRIGPAQPPALMLGGGGGGGGGGGSVQLAESGPPVEFVRCAVDDVTCTVEDAVAQHAGMRKTGLTDQEKHRLRYMIDQVRALWISAPPPWKPQPHAGDDGAYTVYGPIAHAEEEEAE